LGTIAAMRRTELNTTARSLAVPTARELSDSRANSRSVRSGAKHWQPPEGLSPEEVRAVIAAAATERDEARRLMQELTD
jgi:hypothetical protein